MNCKKGSTGKIVYALYSELRANGHDAAICYGRGPLVSEPDIFRFSSKLEVYIHALLTRVTGLTGCFSMFATRRLLRIIEEFKPDIVHIHELHAYFVNIAPLIRYLKKKKQKTVWTFHCEFMFTGKCGNACDCERYQTGCGKCPYLRRYVSSWFFDFTARMLKQKEKLFEGFENLTIAPVSDWLLERAKKSPFLADKHFMVVKNGIDLSVFYPQDSQNLCEKLGLADEKIIIHVAPYFHDAQKGGQHVLKLARMLEGENIKIIIVGAGKPIDDCPQNVIAVSYIADQSELAEYYSLGDVFVITSEMENLPTVCLESLCCGTPVVGFDAGGTSETAPSPYGIFVKHGDVEELNRVVLKVFSNEILLASPEQCAEFGHAHYDKNLMMSNYFNIYSD